MTSTNNMKLFDANWKSYSVRHRITWWLKNANLFQAKTVTNPVPLPIEGSFHFLDEAICKEEEFASMAMQGILASGKWTADDINNGKIAETAVAASKTLMEAIERFKHD